MLNRFLYDFILRFVPILTVDIIVKNKGRYLLVKRNNEPLKGWCYIPGGRVFKGETMIGAAKRKLKEETGLIAQSLKLYGYSEGLFKESHTTSIVFICDKFKGKVKLDSQSSSYKWSKTFPSQWIKRI